MYLVVVKRGCAILHTRWNDPCFAPRSTITADMRFTVKVALVAYTCTVFKMLYFIGAKVWIRTYRSIFGELGSKQHTTDFVDLITVTVYYFAVNKFRIWCRYG